MEATESEKATIIERMLAELKRIKETPSTAFDDHDHRCRISVDMREWAIVLEMVQSMLERQNFDRIVIEAMAIAHQNACEVARDMSKALRLGQEPEQTIAGPDLTPVQAERAGLDPRFYADVNELQIGHAYWAEASAANDDGGAIANRWITIDNIKGSVGDHIGSMRVFGHTEAGNHFDVAATDYLWRYMRPDLDPATHAAAD